MPEAVAVTEQPEGPINTLVRQMSAATAQMRGGAGAASAVTAEVQGAAFAVRPTACGIVPLDEAGGRSSTTWRARLRWGPRTPAHLERCSSANKRASDVKVRGTLAL